jgi:mycothiol S-conjugate amidase
MIKRVVSIGAHSLDAELLGGPLILKYARNGAHCTMIHVTQGRLEDPAASEAAKEAYLADLLQQNKRAAEKLGADSIWLGYVSSKMPSLGEFQKRLADYFVEERVELAITHWRGSMHQRHINTHDAVVGAVKQLREQGNPIKLLYGETFEDLVGFIPQAYFSLDEAEKDQWFSALGEYQVFRGEVNDFPYIPYYTTNGKIRAIESQNRNFTVCYMYASLIERELF